MPEVEQFNRSMVEKFLRSRNYRFLTDSDGDFILQFAYESDADCKISIHLIAAGENNEIYSLTARSDKSIPKSEWGRVVMLCNTWNRERRWPKSYLYVDDSSSARGEIFLEESIDLGTGIHQELLNDFTITMIIGANLFWAWLHKEHGI